MTDSPPRRSLFIGRWQPLHEGHRALIQTAIDDGREVVIGIMDTPASDRNPWAMDARREMIRKAFPTAIILDMPWIDEVCFGRDCGWQARRIHLDTDTESISGTNIRENGIETEYRRRNQGD